MAWMMLRPSPFILWHTLMVTLKWVYLAFFIGSDMILNGCYKGRQLP